MSTVSTILEKARQRAAESGLAYSGALTPDEAFALLHESQAPKWWMCAPMRNGSLWAWCPTPC